MPRTAGSILKMSPELTKQHAQRNTVSKAEKNPAGYTRVSP